MELKTGSAESTLDEKSRVNIPVRFREQYQGKLAMTWGIDQCIYVMTPAAWEIFEGRLRNSEDFSQEEWRFLENKHLNQVMEVEIDKAGRIAIPPTFRRYANLTGKCVVISSVDGYLSIWDSDTFDAYLAENDAVARAAFNKLGPRNIFRAGRSGE